jgi:hypothetical protein
VARGVYNKSIADPNGGYGVADTEMANANAPYEYQTKTRQATKRGLLTAFDRSNAADTLTKTRTEVDVPEKQQRYESELERQRRVEAGQMSNDRGARAYQDYILKMQSQSY